MTEMYRTLGAPAEGIYKEKGSKFLAFAYPVSSLDDIKEQLEILRKKYFDARHHCFAWMLGPEKKQFRAFDDGEPNHSAGDPILGQIRSFDITDVLVVVVRYFGGTKLGVGGLISAYRTAAEEALRNAIIIEKQVTETITITFDYAAMNEVMKLVKDFDMQITSQSFGMESKIELEYAVGFKIRILDRLQHLKVMGAAIHIIQDS